MVKMWLVTCWLRRTYSLSPSLPAGQESTSVSHWIRTASMWQVERKGHIGWGIREGIEPPLWYPRAAGLAAAGWATRAGCAAPPRPPPRLPPPRSLKDICRRRRGGKESGEEKWTDEPRSEVDVGVTDEKSLEHVPRGSPTLALHRCKWPLQRARHGHIESPCRLLTFFVRTLAGERE